MYMDVHKEGTSLSLDGEEAAAAPHELLTGAAPSYSIGIFECLDARVLFIFLRSSESNCPPRQPLVSFLDMLSLGIDAMT